MRRTGEARELTWLQVNFEAGVVRLEPGTTKNREDREFPFAVLQPLADPLKQQRDDARELKRKKGRIISVAMKLTGHKTGAVYRRSVREGHKSGTIGGIITARPSCNELSKWFQQAKFDTTPTR